MGGGAPGDSRIVTPKGHDGEATAARATATFMSPKPVATACPGANACVKSMCLADSRVA